MASTTTARHRATLDLKLRDLLDQVRSSKELIDAVHANYDSLTGHHGYVAVVDALCRELFARRHAVAERGKR